MYEKKTESEWIGILEEWKQSGLGRGEYCKRHKLRLSTFDYWKRKITSKENGNGLVKIQQTLPLRPVPSIPYRMKVTTRDFAIEIAANASTDEIRTVLTACKELL